MTGVNMLYHQPLQRITQLIELASCGVASNILDEGARYNRTQLNQGAINCCLSALAVRLQRYECCLFIGKLAFYRNLYPSIVM